MHELSIIYSILEAAEAEVQLHSDAGCVAAIELEIGALAGVEVSTLEFLWPAAVENTLLEHAACQIHRLPGQAYCSECDSDFPIRQFYDPCPRCGSHMIQITQGEELRIKSLTLVSEHPKPFPLKQQNWN